MANVWVTHWFFMAGAFPQAGWRDLSPGGQPKARRAESDHNLQNRGKLPAQSGGADIPIPVFSRRLLVHGRQEALPHRAQGPLTTAPSFITKTTSRMTPMFSSGLP